MTDFQRETGDQQASSASNAERGANAACFADAYDSRQNTSIISPSRPSNEDALGKASSIKLDEKMQGSLQFDYSILTSGSSTSSMKAPQDLTKISGDAAQEKCLGAPPTNGNNETFKCGVTDNTTPLPPRTEPGDQKAPLPPRSNPGDQKAPLPPRSNPGDQKAPLPPRSNPGDHTEPLPKRGNPGDPIAPRPPRGSEGGGGPIRRTRL